jgi:hypothetical protein
MITELARWPRERRDTRGLPALASPLLPGSHGVLNALPEICVSRPFYYLARSARQVHPVHPTRTSLAPAMSLLIRRDHPTVISL